jgi:hypothetical protein
MRFLRPFNVAGKTKLLELTYMVTAALLLSTVVFATVFITHHFLLVKKYVIQEDAVEAVLISILLLIAYFLSNLYKKEIRKYLLETRKLSRDKSDLSNKLIDAFKYIGGVNVQIKESRSILCGPRRYATTENEFRKDLALFARKVLGIVNADWVVIRIIGQTNLRTIKEHLEFRGNANFVIKGISNKAIVADQAIDGFSIVTSRHDNSMILVACVFPKKSLDEAEKILVEAITYQIEMLYLIFASGLTQEAYPSHKPITRIEKTLATQYEYRLDNSAPHQEQ